LVYLLTQTSLGNHTLSSLLKRLEELLAFYARSDITLTLIPLFNFYYYAFIHPFLIYGVIAWENTYQTTYQNLVTFDDDHFVLVPTLWLLSPEF
jgi:ferric iron reductase protein FhuF